jgi:hypothetical protein
VRIAPGAFVFHRLRQPNSTVAAEMLFQVRTEREETASVAIASNESFSGWTKTFTDPRLRAAIVEGQNLQGGANVLCHSAADLP